MEFPPGVTIVLSTTGFHAGELSVERPQTAVIQRVHPEAEVTYLQTLISCLELLILDLPKITPWVSGAVCTTDHLIFCDLRSKPSCTTVVAEQLDLMSSACSSTFMYFPPFLQKSHPLQETPVYMHRIEAVVKKNTPKYL